MDGVSRHVTNVLGSIWTIVAYLILMLSWAVWGFFAHFSDTWQLVANTVTTLSTGLLVFVIQNAQNRNEKAMHLKLDEIIFAIERADNEFMEIEERGTKEIKEKHAYHKQSPNTTQNSDEGRTYGNKE